jgi:hypothetical protein
MKDTAEPKRKRPRTDTTEKTIDAAIVAQLLEWQETGGVLEQTAFDTFLELLSEARHNGGGTSRAESSFGLDEAGDFVAGLTDFVAGLTGGLFVFHLDRNPDINGLPRKTTVRTRKSNQTFDGQVQVLLNPPFWQPDPFSGTPQEAVRRLSEMVNGYIAAVENEQNEKRSEGE